MTSRAPRQPRALTNADFDENVGSYRVALVDFWAGWCGPCRTMAPDLERVAAEVDDDVLVAKVDVEAQPELAARFGIRSIPTVATFHQGQLRRSYVGAVPAAGLRAALSDADRPPRRGLARKLFGP